RSTKPKPRVVPREPWLREYDPTRAEESGTHDGARMTVVEDELSELDDAADQGDGGATEEKAAGGHDDVETSRKFPVVGIGASAGGLEAFSQLLRALPADTGMAYVLVQHLAPRYESMLSELLSNATSLPVTEVSEGIRVERDHVYVIPPNSSMGISD